MCDRSVVELWHADKFLLRHPHPGDFIASQWPIPWKGYLTFRSITIAYCLIIGVGIIINRNEWPLLSKDKQMNYAFWVYLVYTVSEIWNFACVWRAMQIHESMTKKTDSSSAETAKQSDDKSSSPITSNPSTPPTLHSHPPCTENVDPPEPSYQYDSVYPHDKEGDLPWELKVLWVLRNISYNQILANTLLFWIFFPTGDADANIPPCGPTFTGFTFLALHQGGMGLFFVVMDCFLTASPMRLAHVWCSFVFIVAYLIISTMISWLCNLGTNVWMQGGVVNVLDFCKHPYLSSFILLFVIFVLQPCTQFVLTTLMDTRHSMYVQCYNSHIFD